MSAKKARFIRRINNNNGIVTVNIKLDSKEYADVQLHELSRVELIRSCAMLGIQSGGTWTTWSNDDMTTAIANAVVREGKKHDYADTDGAKGDGERPGKGGDDGVPGEGNGDDGTPEQGDGEQGDGDGTPTPGDGNEGEQGDTPAPAPGDTPAQGDGDGESESDNDADHPLLVQLAEFIAKQGGITNEAEVKAIVDEAVKDLTPHVTEIHLPDGEIKDLPGRQHHNFDLLLRCLSKRLNMYLVGPPGTGKSYCTEQAAKALGLQYASLSLGPQTPESRLWGYYDANGNYVRTPFRDAYEFGWVFCLDEMDNGHPGIIASMNQAIAGSGCTFPDGFIDKHDTFVIVGTANTFGTGPTAEFVGRNILDPATLDRFSTLEWGIDKRVELDMIAAHLDDKAEVKRWHDVLTKIRKNADKYRIKVVCSPRAAGDGAALLSLGLDTRTALDMRVFRGLSPEQTNKLLDGVTV
jgi:MoxR-like ATPase